MRKLILFVPLLLWNLSVYADFKSDGLEPITSDKATDFPVFLDCDTVVNIDGYKVHIINKDGDPVFAGLALFSEEIKNSMDRELLDRIESALYNKSRNSLPAQDPVRIVSGNISDFKAIDSKTPCEVNSLNSRELTVTWLLDGGKVSVRMPISYSAAKNGSRSEIENKFIARLKSGTTWKRGRISFDVAALQPYGKDRFILPGESYQRMETINRNVYLEPDGENPVWDRNYPSESIANLMLFPSDIYGRVSVDLTVRKHGYGEKETLTVPLETLLDVCSRDGCNPYWGVEKFENGKLKGVLFFFNRSQGYSHVVRVECDVDDIFAGKGIIKSIASLYIPTNNVQDLFAPYVKKTDKERIKYKDNK